MYCSYIGILKKVRQDLRFNRTHAMYIFILCAAPWTEERGRTYGGSGQQRTLKTKQNKNGCLCFVATPAASAPKRYATGWLRHGASKKPYLFLFVWYFYPLAGINGKNIIKSLPGHRINLTERPTDRPRSYHGEGCLPDRRKNHRLLELLTLNSYPKQHPTTTSTPGIILS